MAETAKLIIKAEDKASAKLKKIGDTGETSMKGLKISAGVATAAIVGIGVAIGGTIALFSRFTRATEIQEQAELQLANALRNAGQDADAALPKLKSFASGLQDITTFGDEAILGMQTLLVSLGGLSGQGLEEATKATLDLASALKIDLKAAALLMGKAAAGESSTLTRYGLVIEKGSNKAETFSNVLKAVNEKFGGAAQTQAETFGGKIQQISNAFGDLEEDIGKVITENEAFKGMLDKLIEKIPQVSEEITNWVKVNQPLIDDLAKIAALSFMVVDSVRLWAGATTDVEALKNKIIEQELALENLSDEYEFGIGTYSEQKAAIEKSIESYKKELEILENLASGNEDYLNRIKDVLDFKYEALGRSTEIGNQELENAEQRNFDLEQIELDFSERRVNIRHDEAEQKILAMANESEQSLLIMEDKFEREKELLALKQEEELLLLEEKLAATEEATEAHNEILAQIDETKKLQELERENFLAKGKAKIADKKLKDDDKRRQKELKSILKFTNLDAELWAKKEKSKMDIAKMSADYIQMISSNLMTALGKQSRTLFALNKAVAIAQAIINTAQGATKALAQGGFLGIALAAAVIAFGAVQIANIASQKMPAMAEGGIITKPTTILAGEAGAESIIPLDRADEEGFATAEDRPPIIINFTGPVLGDPEQAREFAIAIDEELYDLKTEGQSLAFA